MLPKKTIFLDKNAKEKYVSSRAINWSLIESYKISYQIKNKDVLKNKLFSKIKIVPHKFSNEGK